ncbi:hypothetical protein KP003_04080 [Geomonas nitrogeniifigens]|uniref:hypothetical protein n=1 Tax=Geomonas diazotrophica TaxID=2843197 RepID=UPI001C2C6354|nr:hypothetical protein [Geomonas nitrogeniifigens]QXE87591.1 hypothetical protein KP003_04080 [Geomonas nitrogeniifigens]
MFLILRSTPDRRENRPPKQRPLLDRNAHLVPRHDLRMSLPSRQVRIFVGEGLFCQQEAPLL